MKKKIPSTEKTLFDFNVEQPEEPEIITRVNELIRKLFTDRYYFWESFWKIPMPWSEPGILETLCAHPKKKWPYLHQLVKRFHPGSRFDFWKMCFKNQHRIPQRELLKIWYYCLNDHKDPYHQIIPTQYGKRKDEFEYTAILYGDLKRSVVTDPILIDDPIVAFRYCQVQKPGWEMLQYIHGRRYQNLSLPPSLLSAIEKDSVPAFGICYDMSNRALSYSMLMTLINHNAANIFRYLVQEEKINHSIIPPSELCVLFTTSYGDETSIPMLTIMEEKYPGIIKNTKDAWGRNLLWYAIQNLKTGWFHPDSKLVPFLLAHGCDPQNPNQIGFSWLAIQDVLTDELQKKMMYYRYNLNRNVLKSLRKTQPLEHLCSTPTAIP